MSSDLIKQVSDATFEAEVLRAEVPVLVEFFSASALNETITPGLDDIAPVLEDLASEHQGNLLVVRLNVDAYPTTAPMYGVRGIPALLLFERGEVAATKVGPLSKADIQAFLDENL